MKRPADQAKLLVFYLLRSSAALATENPKLAQILHHEGHICLRLARRTDVPSLQRCNLATLPENYNSQFYVSHLRQWPDLALVAEHVPSSRTATRNPSSAFPHGAPEPKIVAYVLGKVEDKPTRRPFAIVPNHHHQLSAEDRDELEETTTTTTAVEPLGHVTSLAVLQDYRRQGLAAALMSQLHLHLAEAYNVQGVGLHVRKSNEAACQLYEKDGYTVEEVIPQYYQDGEDAYFMRKPLEGATVKANKWSSALRRPRPWETGPLPYRLPRTKQFNNPSASEHATTTEQLSQEKPQIITGSL